MVYFSVIGQGYEKGMKTITSCTKQDPLMMHIPFQFDQCLLLF